MAASAASALPEYAASSAPAASTASARIDCQSHLFCPEAVAVMETRKSDPLVFTRDGEQIIKLGDWLRKIPPHDMDLDVKLAAMNANGITMTALSINDPGPEWFGADGAAMAQIFNDFVAGIVRRHRTRFFGLCVLPLQEMRASLAELDRCVRNLGMKGILLYTNMAVKFPDEPEFLPLFARAFELDIPVLLHPAKPMTTDVVKGYEMTSSLGNMFDYTIALTRIIMSGVLDEFPKLKLACPHLGGTLPYIIARLDHQTQVLKRGPKVSDAITQRVPIVDLAQRGLAVAARDQLWLRVHGRRPAAVFERSSLGESGGHHSLRQRIRHPAVRCGEALFPQCPRTLPAVSGSFILVVCLVGLCVSPATVATDETVELRRQDDRIRIEIGEKLFRQFSGDGGNGRLANVVEAVRSRETVASHAPVSGGRLSSVFCNLGNVSSRLSRKASLAACRELVPGHKNGESVIDRPALNPKANEVEVNRNGFVFEPWLEVAPYGESIASFSRGGGEALALAKKLGPRASS